MKLQRDTSDVSLKNMLKTSSVDSNNTVSTDDSVCVVGLDLFETACATAQNNNRCVLFSCFSLSKFLPSLYKSSILKH